VEDFWRKAQTWGVGQAGYYKEDAGTGKKGASSIANRKGVNLGKFQKVYGIVHSGNPDCSRADDWEYAYAGKKKRQGHRWKLCIRRPDLTSLG